MALILIVGVKEGLAHMLAALVQVDDRVNLSKSIFHSKTFSACSHLECLHVSNTSALLVEEAVIHPLPDVVMWFNVSSGVKGFRPKLT